MLNKWVLWPLFHYYSIIIINMQDIFIDVCFLPQSRSPNKAVACYHPNIDSTNS